MNIIILTCLWLRWREKFLIWSLIWDSVTLLARQKVISTIGLCCRFQWLSPQHRGLDYAFVVSNNRFLQKQQSTWNWTKSWLEKQLLQHATRIHAAHLERISQEHSQVLANAKQIPRGVCRMSYDPEEFFVIYKYQRELFWKIWWEVKTTCKSTGAALQFRTESIKMEYFRIDRYS